MKSKIIFSFIFLLFFSLSIFSQPQGEYVITDVSAQGFLKLGQTSALTNLKNIGTQSKLSITFWVRWENKNTEGVGIAANMLTMANIGEIGNDGQFWFEHNLSNEYITFTLRTSNGITSCVSDISPVDGAWYFVAAVYDGSTVKLFINNELQDTRFISGTVFEPNENSNVFLGRSPSTANDSKKFFGSFDEISIWYKALNESDLASLIANPESVTGSNHDATGLVGYWNFTSGSYSDLSPSSNPFVGSAKVQPVNWLGADNNWSNTNNWNLNRLPDETDNITIKESTNYPIIQSGTNVNINRLEIVENAQLSIGANSTLGVKSTLVNRGTITVEGLITFKSDQNGTATLVDFGTINFVASGAIVQQRYLSANKNHYVSVSTANTNSNVFNGAYPNYSGYNEDNDTPDWGNGWYTVGPNETLGVGKGYTVYFFNNTTASFTGTFNKGTLNVPVTNHGYHTDPNIDGWNLIGNPYPAALSVNSFLQTNLGKIDGNAVYMWDEGGTNYSSSDYATYNSVGSVAGGGGNRPNGFVAPGQAFFVHVTHNYDIEFNDNMKQTTGNQFFKTQIHSSGELTLSLVNPSNIYNEILIALLPEATDNFDQNLDAIKVKGNPNLAFYSLLNDKEYAIQSLSQNIDNLKVVALGYDATLAGNYKLNVIKKFNFGNSFIYLNDLLNNSLTLMNETSEYQFVSQAGTFKNRFQIIISEKILSVPNVSNESHFLIYSQNKEVFIQATDKVYRDAQFVVYDILGKEILRGKMIDTITNFQINSQGTFIIKIIENNKVYNQKIVIN